MSYYNVNTRRFQEIMEEIDNLVHEAAEIAREHPDSSITARVDAYWKPQIIGIIDGTATMQGMVNTLEELLEDEEDNDEEKEEN